MVDFQRLGSDWNKKNVGMKKGKNISQALLN